MQVVIKSTNTNTINTLINDENVTKTIAFAQGNFGPSITLGDQHLQESLPELIRQAEHSSAEQITIVYTPTGGKSSCKCTFEVGPEGPVSMTATFKGRRGSIYNSGVGAFFWVLARAVQSNTAKVTLYETSVPEMRYYESKLACMARLEGEHLPAIVEECRKAVLDIKPWRAVYAAFPAHLIAAVRRQYQY